MLEEEDLGNEEEWCKLQKVLEERANEIIPKSPNRNKQRWKTDEILDLMETHRRAKNEDSENYKVISNLVKRK